MLKRKARQLRQWLRGRAAATPVKPGGPKLETLEERLLLSLLGVGIEVPAVNYDVTGTAAYNAAAQTFDSSATPVSIQFSAGSRPFRIEPPRDFQLHFLVDNDGGVIGGVAGDDFYIEGDIDINRDRIADYSGILLTGEIQQFGHLDAGTSTDQYDFRLTPTGGELMPFFEGKDIGIRMTSTGSTFEGVFTADFSGGAQGVIGPIEPLAAATSVLSGRVFNDANNNGVDDGEAGIADVLVTLTGTDENGNPVEMAAITGADGSYSFLDLAPGTYTITETQPADYLDGQDAVGTLGGTVANDEISLIYVAGEDGSGYNFGELEPASLSGLVYLDSDNDGEQDAGEQGIEGVTVSLTGTSDLGEPVALTTQTDAAGAYLFGNLRPGTYTVTETQPVDYLDGLDTAGDLGGAVADDVLSDIAVTPGDAGSGYNFGELEAASLAGTVFHDADNDGEQNAGEEGIAGATVTLSGTDDRGEAVAASAVTAADGSYSFENLRPGTYTINETQPAGYLDGADTTGTLGGAVADDTVGQIAVASGDAGVDYNFGEITPASVSGFVYEDFNDDGLIDFNEYAIEGVEVTLTGTNDRGEAVYQVTLTDADGMYFFYDLRPGEYTITETQPIDFQDGKDTVGTAGGVVGDDQFSAVGITAGTDAMNYNFGERPEAGVTVAHGQTATIGFWQNKNGQRLIESLNGGASATQLGNWLAATFPNLYGINAGDRNLAGLNNAEVADFYRDELFKAKKNKKIGGPAKVDAQVMGTAFAVYVTNSNLAGNAGESYGFIVDSDGVGVATWNVGDSGEAFGLADYSDATIMDLLLATDAMAVEGRLYDYDTLLRTLANEVYTAINEAGDI